MYSMNKFVLEERLSIGYDRFSKRLQMRINKEMRNKWPVYFAKLGVTKYSIYIREGFRWDGCTPSINFFGIWLGTPDGRKDETGKPRMFVPSCVHDILYINLDRIPLSRKTVDLIFYELAKEKKFLFAGLYYIAVRALGGIYRSIKKIKI
jgi:hypothetical protein